MLQNKNVYFLNWNGAKPERFEKKTEKILVILGQNNQQLRI